MRRTDLTARSPVALAVSAAVLAALVLAITGSAAFAATLSPKAQLLHDVSVSRTNAEFVTLKRTGPSGGVVSTRYSKPAKTVTDTQDGRIRAIELANSEWAFVRSSAKSKHYCWAHAKVPGAFEKSLKLLYGGISTLAAGGTVTSTKVHNDKSGARTRFALSWTENNGTVDHRVIYAGASGRIIQETSTLFGSDLYTYPSSQPAVKVPSGKAVCPAGRG